MKMINASLAILSALVIAACSSVQATNQAPDGIIPPPPPKADHNQPLTLPEAPSVHIDAPPAPRAQNAESGFYLSDMQLSFRNNDPERYMTVDGKAYTKAEVPQAIIDKVAEINAEASVIEAKAEVVEQDITKKMDALKPLLDKMKVKAQSIVQLQIKEKMREVKPKIDAMKLAIKNAKVSEVDQAELEELQVQIEQRTEHLREERMHIFEADMQLFEEKLAVKEKELRRLIADFIKQQS